MRPRLHRIPRSSLARPGRQRDRSQRRAVRPAGEPDHAGAGDLLRPKTSATRARSTTAGRPGAAGSPATTGPSSGSECPGSSTASSSTRRGSRATTRPTSRWRRPSIEGYPRRPSCWTADVGHPGGEDAECQGDSENTYEVSDQRPVDPRPAEASSPTAAWPASACTARSSSTHASSPARSICPRRRTAARLLDTSDVFYSSPANLISASRARIMGEGWENARRRGRRQRLGGVQARRPGRADAWSRSTPPTSSATPRAGADQRGRRDHGFARGRQQLVGHRAQDPLAGRHPASLPGRRAARSDPPAPGRLPRWRSGSLRCYGEIAEDVRKDLYDRFFEALPEEHQHYIEAQADPEIAAPANVG